MSDLTLIADDILNTMQTIEEAHAASEKLRQQIDPAALSALRKKMVELQDRLEKLKIVLDNEEAFAMDELVDALSLVYTDHRSTYRKTPRMNV
jgi:hypothetical protein